MSRKTANILFKYSTRIAVLLCTSLLLFLFGVVIWNGLPAISMDFLTMDSKDFGAAGGVFYQIAGSLLLIVTAALLSFPVALGTAIFKSEFIHNQRWQNITNIFIYSLNGVPSVIFGVFGLIFFVNILGMGISWFVGSVILAMMILPTITLATFQSINSIPDSYRETAMGLGLTKWQIIIKVLLPQGISGSVTGLLIGLARAIGETAPIMFVATAFSGVGMPGSLLEPVLSLPTHILSLAQQATNPAALQNAWGASLLLITLAMIFSITALYLRILHRKKVQL